MIKLLRKSKSLLVAAALLAGANGAWAAETTTLLEYGTAEVAWTAENLATWTAGGTPTLADGVVTISGSNGSYATSKAITADANTIINVKAVWRGSSSTGRAFEKGNGSYFLFGDKIVVAQNDQDKKHGYTFKGLDDMANVTTFTAGSYRVDVTSSTWLLIEMEINTATNTLTSFTIKSEDGATTYVTQSDITLPEGATFGQVAFGYRKSGSVTTTNKEQLKSVIVTQTTQDVSVADYKVKYVCGGTEVKAAVTRSSVVGEAITLTSDDYVSFYDDAENPTKKYIYSGDGSELTGKTVLSDGSAVVEVPFREAATWSYSVEAKYGTKVLETILTGSVFEQDKASGVHKLYYNVDGTLVKNDSGDKNYTYSIIPTKDNYTSSLEYALTDINNVVFFSEAEDIETLEPITSAYLPERFSGNKGAYAKDADQVITTLPAGKYKLTAHIMGTQSVCTFTFKAGSETIWENATSGESFYIGNGITGSEFTLTETTDIILVAAGGDGSSSRVTNSVDFIYIVRTDAPKTVTITSAGWATLYTDKALDFSGVTGLEAYTATTDGTNVTLNKVNDVPAGTGVVLKGAADDYTIPVIASSETAKGDLLGSATAATAFDAIDGKDIYMLAKNGENAQFKKVSAGSVAAGKAYLAVAKSAAPALNVVFAGADVTAIKAVDAAQQNGAVFNLAGQRVAQPTKGLYIVNGKKIAIK
ncbi:MAG: hypothetical protein IJ637_03195 [Prevotella sp.]|nr:hypothetical protein [Prevotella sp.]